MYNLYTKFVKVLEICKQFSENLVNELSNVPRRGPVPKFSYLEVVALSLTAETESIDSKKWLFDYKLQEYKSNICNPYSIDYNSHKYLHFSQWASNSSLLTNILVSIEYKSYCRMIDIGGLCLMKSSGKQLSTSTLATQ